MLTPSSVHVVVLCAMTDPLSNNRLMVLRCVADHPGATVITLAKYLPQEMPQGTATGQLGPLQRAGLIETHRQDDRRYWVTRAGRTALRAQPPPNPSFPDPRSLSTASNARTRLRPEERRFRLRAATSVTPRQSTP